MTGQRLGRPAAPGPRCFSARFDLEQLAATRQSIMCAAQGYGLRGHELDGFILAVNEIIANAIAHGGGHGRMRLWSDGHRLRCQVTDNGPGLPVEYRAAPRPPLSAAGGRGLWLARHFCRLEIRTSAYGTTIELSTPAPRRDVIPAFPA